MRSEPAIQENIQVLDKSIKKVQACDYQSEELQVLLNIMIEVRSLNFSSKWKICTYLISLLKHFKS